MEEKMNLFVKRVFDIVCSLVGIIILSPLFLIVSIAIKLDSKGSVLFKQERRTKNGRVFKIYKFRSMCMDAEKKGTGLFNFENDSRITKVGRFLRNSSIDELPQLINVLKGDMALVGPRPLLTQYLPLYNKEQMRRHEVRPGITGWAQVNGRNAISWTKKIELDVWYVNNLSFCLDLKILFLTIKKVFYRVDINSANDVTMEDFDGTN